MTAVGPTHRGPLSNKINRPNTTLLITDRSGRREKMMFSLMCMVRRRVEQQQRISISSDLQESIAGPPICALVPGNRVWRAWSS